MDISTAAINVVLKFFILKSATMVSVIHNKKALITNLNKPKVIKINGNVKKTSNHPISRFNMLNTRAIEKEVLYPFIFMPGSKLATIKIDKLNSKKLIIIDIFILYS